MRARARPQLERRAAWARLKHKQKSGAGAPTPPSTLRWEDLGAPRAAKRLRVARGPAASRGRARRVRIDQPASRARTPSPPPCADPDARALLRGVDEALQAQSAPPLFEDELPLAAGIIYGERDEGGPRWAINQARGGGGGGGGGVGCRACAAGAEGARVEGVGARARATRPRARGVRRR